MFHKDKSSLAGRTVRIKATSNYIGGREFCVEDWWDRVSGKSWMHCDGNPACMHYAMRSGFSVVPIPTDNEVLYGKIGPFGKLVHISEIEQPETGDIRLARSDPARCNFWDADGFF